MVKEAYIIPIYKDSDREDCNNYRPISILPTISKIFEKHLSNELKEFFRKTNVLNKHQSGFRENHSCQTALIRLIDEWLKDVDNGNCIGSVFIDMKKAFDLVDHEILLYKLKLHHFSDGTLSLFHSYLSQRQQCVKLGTSFSTPLTIKSGVPQGSILGPLLFLIYINDIGLLLNQSDIDLYADDTTLYATGANPSEIQTNLQNDIYSIQKWCTLNNMMINPNKSKCMLIGSKQKIKNINLNLKIDNNAIENVTSHKILGLYIDKHLQWKVHIDKTCSKISSKITLLKKISNYLTFDMKKLFHNSYILTTFDYCCTIWGSANKTNLTKVNVLQKRAAKVILQKPNRTPSKELFLQLKWLSFNNRCKYHTAILIYKCVNNQTPEYLNNIITFSQNHKYNLRSATHNDIVNTKANTGYKKRAFSYHSMDIWNSIPIEIRMACSISAFKRQYKTHLFSNQ